MDLLLIVLTGVIASIVNNLVFYYRSEQGKMDVEWNEEDGVWDAKLQIPTNVDYSKKNKLIIKINKK